jgi:hypothetical protein
VIDGGIIEAVVQVGTDETPYLRCGRGQRVVVVLTGDADERLRLMRHYSGACCVIAPVPDAAPWMTPPAAAGAGDWIGGVVDGLGLARPVVVLAPDLAWLAEWLADGSGETFELMGAVSPHPR